MQSNISKDVCENSKPKQEVVQELEVLEKNVENENNENNNESKNNKSKEPKKIIFGVDATPPKIINVQPK